MKQILEEIVTTYYEMVYPLDGVYNFTMVDRHGYEISILTDFVIARVIIIVSRA